MDINQYKNFITVIESGTITRAASRLNIAQPALSNQIKNLENEFGAELLQKGAVTAKYASQEPDSFFTGRPKQYATCMKHCTAKLTITAKV